MAVTLGFPLMFSHFQGSTANSEFHRHPHRAVTTGVAGGAGDLETVSLTEAAMQLDDLDWNRSPALVSSGIIPGPTFPSLCQSCAGGGLLVVSG